MATNHTQNVAYPFGLGDEQTYSPVGSQTQSFTINDDFTIIHAGGVTATAGITLAISSELQSGAEIFLIASASSTYSVVFGTGFTAPTISTSINKISTQKYTYSLNDGVFYPSSGVNVVN
jgi:hypothetical protein